MPVINGLDKFGRYYQWGKHGKKYYYISGDKITREIARNRAIIQGRAIYKNRNY